MSLSAHEAALYQNALKHVAELSLNLMAVKVTNHPSDFNGWCLELIDVCKNRINFDLLDDHQLKPLKKLTELLASGIGVSQFRMAGIAPWPFYVEFLTGQQTNHALEERLRLLNFIRGIKTQPLNSLIKEDRLAFVGKHTANHDPKVFDFDVEWFGATKGAKAFQQIIDTDASLIEQALEHIPLEGEVNREHYQAFVDDYSKAFTAINEKPLLYPATRLLAMRRPDQFVVLTSAKVDDICQGLGISKLSTTDFSGYWSGIVSAIRAMHWWRSEEPELEEEKALWHHRAILLDMLLYADEATAQKSNYLKLLNKPTRAKASGGSRTVKKTKESAEAMVDRVLADEEIPDFIKAQRDSIVAQVQAGKKIDEIIALLNKIFG
ncbi:hypothetical protein CW748_07475 [Alteromonadales bacterium alter-6D02]|nr:hypothetical protein CW748_07475 [Alteromonadales bacterium alter-6D02]